MTESFAELFEQSILTTNLTPGTIVQAKVLDIGSDYVTVNAGLKSEGIIPVEEFKSPDGEIEVAVGDEVDVTLDSVEDGFGETILSREKAKRFAAWRSLEKLFKANETVIGVITDRVKGGFTVDINKVRAFLPGSLVDVRPVRDPSYLQGKSLEFKVIKMDQKRNNIVVSRRAVVESEGSAERDALLKGLKEGQELKGIVKNLTDYGAFIDLGGIDGLLHITDISWKRVKHPGDVLTIGDEIDVKILKFDRERNRVSLGMKQLGEDPWSELMQRYPVGTKLSGKVTNITDYGCFVEIDSGVEGLVHMSEMDWTNKNINPAKLVHLGDEVEVMVLEFDAERRRISLGMKQCDNNPWATYAESHKKGEIIQGSIKSLTDFGIFIGLEGGIDGLIHMSDISWTLPGDEAIKGFAKGQEVEAVILAVDPARERISLGIKQLTTDAFGSYTDEHGKGTIVTGKVIEVESKLVTVELVDQVHGTIKVTELSKEKVMDANDAVKVGDDIEAKITNIDRKIRTITLSVRAKETQEEKAAMKKYSRDAADSSSGGTLGDILKEKMTAKTEEEK